MICGVFLLLFYVWNNFRLDIPQGDEYFCVFYVHIFLGEFYRSFFTNYNKYVLWNSFLWVVIKKKALISTKTFIGKIPMSSRFNQSKVYFYVHIYPALSIIYCAQMVFATLVRCSCQVWWSIFRFSKVVVFHCINGLFLKAAFLVALKKLRQRLPLCLK